MNDRYVIPTRDQYEAIFNQERDKEYQEVDFIERFYKFSVNRDWLDKAAFILNCPVKVNPPNWQHGRVIYSALRYMVETSIIKGDSVSLVDIGTAKGFSACVMAKALADAGQSGISVESVDVMDPAARVRRNTVAELDGLKTVYEVVTPFLPVTVPVNFHGDGSIAMLERLANAGTRVPFAFVDGKHSYEFVRREAAALAEMQKPNDIVIFDDCQIPEVNRAVSGLRTFDRRYVDIGPRTYVIGRRK